MEISLTKKRNRNGRLQPSTSIGMKQVSIRIERINRLLLYLGQAGWMYYCCSTPVRRTQHLFLAPSQTAQESLFSAEETRGTCLAPSYVSITLLEVPLPTSYLSSEPATLSTITELLVVKEFIESLVVRSTTLPDAT